MNIRILLPLLTALFFLGCAAAPTPRYTVFTPSEPRALPAGYTGLSVRLADDIRSAPNPLCFHADGTVTLRRDLAYYAPIEIALARALQDTFSACKTAAALHTPLRITVRSFGMDERSGGPKAVVRLELPAEGLDICEEKPLPDCVTAQQLRDALGETLLQAVDRLCAELESRPRQ